MNPRILLALLVPFAPFVAAIVAYVPLAAPSVIGLRGEWHVIDDDSGAADIDAADIAAATKTVQLPGPLPRAQQKLKLARTFTIDDARAAAVPWVVVFGGVSNGVIDVYVNGAYVGSEGVSAAGYKREHIALAAYEVAPDRLRVGANTLVVFAAFEGPANRDHNRVAVVDQRLLAGPAPVVRPWFDRVVLLERLLQLGGIFVLAFVLVLVLTLSAAERDAASRHVQWAAAAVCAAIVLYLAGKSGMAIGPDAGRAIIPLAVTSIGLVMPELLERAFLGHTTRFQVVNRVVCGVDLVVQLTADGAWIYLVFIPWLFVVMAWGLFIVMRGLQRARNTEAALLAGSVAAMIAAGLNDLLTDLSLMTTPRLFTLAAIDMALIGSVFVVGRFLRAMSENARLLVSVEEKNRALSTALDRAEESTRLKSAFLANTSHELRTPLNSIINVPEGLLEEFVQRPFINCSSCQSIFEATEGYAVKPDEACPECGAKDVLRTELRAVFVGDPDAAMRYLGAIQQSGRHLLAVVNDILDFSKLEAGRMVVHVEDIALRDVLDSISAVMTPLCESRRLRLVVADIDADVRVDSDRVKLAQVLMNLLSNAIKFSPEDAVVEVAVDVSERVVFRVVDHGIGIADADKARVFESFSQLDNSHTRKHGGTGLGLAITQRIVELLHGGLRIETTAGGGATFVVDVPRRAPATSSSSSSLAAASAPTAQQT